MTRPSKTDWHYPAGTRHNDNVFSVDVVKTLSLRHYCVLCPLGSRMVSPPRHKNEPTVSRNDSPLGRLHLVLAYRYNFCIEEIWKHVSAQWQQDNYQLWANCFMCWKPVANVGIRVSRRIDKDWCCVALCSVRVCYVMLNTISWTVRSD